MKNKRILSFFTACAMIFSVFCFENSVFEIFNVVSVSAAEVVDSGQCGDNLTYTLTSDGVLTISGTGSMTNWEYNSSPWYNNGIKSVVIETGVTSIGAKAFSHCSNLIKITIPDSVYSIGGYAFWECRKLTSIKIPDGIEEIDDWTFFNCSLTEIEIPNSVRKINYAAFYGNKFTTVTIPDSVKSIGDYAFGKCDNLKSVTISDSVNKIGEHVFNERTATNLIDIHYEGNEEEWKTIDIAGKNDEIFNANIHFLREANPNFEDYLEYKVKSDNTVAITGYKENVPIIVRIPDKINGLPVTSIEECVDFGEETCSRDLQYALENIVKIQIPDTVTEIGDYAFCDFYSLSEIIIPNSVIKFGNYSFFNLTSLKNIYYQGTEEEWNNIIRGIHSGASSKSSKYKIHFLGSSSGGNNNEEDDIIDGENSGHAKGKIEIEDIISKDVFSVELPTVPEETFNFILDPQKLITATNADAYSNAGFEAGKTFYFANTPADANDPVTYSHVSDAITVKNLSNSKVTLTVTGKIKNAEGITFTEDAPEDNKAQIQLKITGGTSDSAAFKENDGIISAELSADIAAVPDENFKVKYGALKGYTFELADDFDDSTAPSYTFKIEGDASYDKSGKAWKGMKDIQPEIELVWSIENPFD